MNNRVRNILIITAIGFGLMTILGGGVLVETQRKSHTLRTTPEFDAWKKKRGGHFNVKGVERTKHDEGAFVPLGQGHPPELDRKTRD